MARISAADLSHALRGVQFPINTRQLAEHARQNRASDEVIKTIKDFGNREFSTLADVEHIFSATGKGGKGEPPSAKGPAAARKGGKH